MAAISNSFDMFFRAHDYASRVIGNINVSMAAQLGTFVQMGYKVPLVSRQVSAAMVVTSQATERYIRDLKELQKYSELNTKTAVKVHGTMEQTGGDLGDIIKLTNQLWESNHKLFNMDNKIWLGKMKNLGIITEENGALDDQNKFIQEATKYLEQYKPGMDRAREAEYAFGDAAYANLVPLAAEKKLLDDFANDTSFQNSVKKNQQYIDENRVALLDLNQTFKKLGSDITEIVLPVLTVLIDSFTMTIKVIKWLASPIIYVLKQISGLITAFKEWSAVGLILGKIILWVAVFCLGFFIRNMLVTMATLATDKIIAMGGAFTYLGKSIYFVSRLLIGSAFIIQETIMSTKDYIDILKKCKGVFFELAKGLKVAALAMLDFLMWTVVITAALVLLWMLVNKLAKFLLYLGEKVFGFFAKTSEYANEMSQAFRDAKDSMDAWSVETVFGKMIDKMGAVNEKAKEGTKTTEHMYDLSRTLYDSLGDTLERAINLPASVIPALAARMKLNKELLSTVQQASIEMGKIAAIGYQQGPKSPMVAGSVSSPQVLVNVDLDKNALGEFYARQQSGR